MSLRVPRRPMQPRRYNQRQVVQQVVPQVVQEQQQGSQSTLNEPEQHEQPFYDHEDQFNEQFDEPLSPPKLNIAIYDEKELPITPITPRESASRLFIPSGPPIFHRPPTPPSKPSTSNRW
ncbi:hypothetical protein FRC20_008730, partial [Serendipita sp. 405]